MNYKLQAILSVLRTEFERIYGERLEKMVLFGSHARGDAEQYSDIDVLVVLKGSVRTGDEIERTGQFVSSLCLENNVVISCVFMDEERFRTRHGPLLRNIRREGVAI